MPVNTDKFLNDYTQAINSFDPIRVASFYSPPTVIMHDHDKKVMLSHAEVEDSFVFTLGQLQQAGVANLEPSIQQTIRLSDSLFFTKIHWRSFDQQSNVLFSCVTSFTLQEMPNNELKIIVVVVADTDNALSKIFMVN